MKAEQRLEREYEARGGVGVFPWAAIIQALVGLLPAICPAKRAKRWAKNHPEAAKEAIANAMKDGGFSSASKNDDLVDSAYETFLKMSNNEIEELKE